MSEDEYIPKDEYIPLTERDYEKEYNDELEETKQIFDIERGVKDIIEKFGITEKQAFFCWFVALGRTPLQAARMCYTYSDDSNVRSQAGRLMSMWKIKEVLSYLNNDQMVDQTLQEMRVRLINWGIGKLALRGYNHSASVGIWKTLMGLSMGDKVKNADQGISKSLEKLGEMFKLSEAAKERGMEAFKKPVGEKKEDDVRKTKH